MFIFTPNRRVKDWPVSINVAIDGGKVEELEIRFSLNLLPVDKYMAALSVGDKNLFDAILQSFDGIADEKGQPLVDTRENRAALYQHAPFTDALLRAYRAANSGEAARKNS